MKNNKFFLSEIFTNESPIQVKIIDLETGEQFKKKVTDFIKDSTFLAKLDAKDIYDIGVLTGMEIR